MVSFPAKIARAAGSGASVPVECCQVCGHAPLTRVLSLGYMPPVNQMVAIGEVPRQQPWFPTDLLHCAQCDLVQLGLAVDPVIIFPPEYPYTSGTTKLLRDNFAELYAEASALLKLAPRDLVIDIGSNDGTLLSNFKNHRILGIEPTEVGKIANGRGIPTLMRYFTPAVAAEVKREHGRARVVTAANCFAHIEDVHSIVEGILDLMGPDGVFISESHYLVGLLDRLQYDTIYHEHLRYYCTTRSTASPTSCKCTGSKSFTRVRSRPTADRFASMLGGAARSRSMTASRKCSLPSRAGKRCSRG
jgi:hypothetical protein